MSPTNTAALAGGVALGGALLSFSKSAAQVGPDIVKPATKTVYLESLDKLRSGLEDAFKDRGGVDPGAPCVAKRKRFRLRSRDLISEVLNDLRCAIDSLDTLNIHLNVENPDPTVIADDLQAVGTRAQDLETDESDDDDDDDETTTTSKTTTASETTTESETATKRELTSQRTTDTSKTTNSVPRTSASMTTTVTNSNPTSLQTTTATKTWSSVSKTSASRTATVSSGQMSNATCYTGSEYLFPASATAPAANDGQSLAFQLAKLALATFFAMDPPLAFTARFPTSTLTKNHSITMSSSEMISTLTQSSRSLLVVRSSSSNINWAFAQSSLGRSVAATPKLTNPNAVPIPGQNGVAGCVYEM